MVENPFGARQKVKSIIDLEVGDYCLIQQSVAIDKLEKKEAQKLLKMLKNIENA